MERGLRAPLSPVTTFTRSCHAVCAFLLLPRSSSSRELSTRQAPRWLVPNSPTRSHPIFRLRSSSRGKRSFGSRIVQTGSLLSVTRASSTHTARVCRSTWDILAMGAVLHLGGIRSPLDAVRAAIVAERRHG
jgi:hypothetical protein